MKKRFFILFCFLLVIYIIFVIFGRHIETILTFPGMYISSDSNNIQSFKKIYDIKEVTFDSYEDNTGSGIFINNDEDYTILFYLPNGVNISNFISDIAWFGNQGYNVAAMDYPGYGKSQGWPSEENVYKSTQNFYNYLINDKNISSENIIVGGYSIGSAPAINIAEKNEVKSLFLISPFNSRNGMSEFIYGIPIQKYLFLEDSFKNYKKIQKVTVPTLIMHGKQDKVVPWEMGKEILENSGADNKKFLLLEEYDHNTMFFALEDVFDKYINDFILHEDKEDEFVVY
ncbi:alpha/beta hydrolase [Candidatus Absconditicoccus praedator]|uniref:alpha/beta hydrolase n=1 Tax=Candidatus Absconditicoccus praedator TaxID=2735562 RepID=UPI001E58886B|nr:alpha/beta fold hydrolase [Candidatus Absconditicoccus praedator]UFX83078.1 alpha/beta hydrolase [Candidatus Absconditicoccus praedator]